MNLGIKIEEKSTDKIAGRFSGLPYVPRLASGDWTPYLSAREHQSPPESFFCVSFSCNHCIDTQINYLMDNGLLSKEATEYIYSAGYMIEGKFNSSDKFLGIMSGTTKEGNSLQKVLDTVRHFGLLPEKDLPFGKANSWEELTNPKQITPAMKEKALKILQYIEISYEWIIRLDEIKSIPFLLTRHLKQAPIQIAIPICGSFSDGKEPITTCGLRESQHAIMVYKVDTLTRTIDQYTPFEKNLALNYPILYGMKIVVISKTKPYELDVPPLPKIETPLTPQNKNPFIDALTEWLKTLAQQLQKLLRK